MAQSEAKSSANFFLDGNFAPVLEEREAQDMAVSGKIPSPYIR
jgi:hypothetical protein